MTALIIGIIVMLTLSAFFSGMEIAFVSSNRMLAEMEKEKNGPAQRAITLFYHHPNNFISTMLVGNNIVLVVYGILFANLFDQTLFSGMQEGARVASDTCLSTIVVLFTGEFLPKTIFKNSPNRLLTFFAPLAWLFYVVLFPISKIATLLARVLLRLFGMRINNDNGDTAFSKVDLDYLVQKSLDNAKEDDEQKIDDEVKIFHNALDFSDTKVRDCMVPRTEIEAVDIDDCTLSSLRSRFIESGYSKIIVYRDDIDHIIGYVHSSEMFRLSGVKDDALISSLDQTLIRAMPFVPETMAARTMMQQLLAQKKSIAVVVDEFGGTSGLISLEDIVEEIFGDIEDEHDSQNYVAKKLDDGSYLLSARLEIEKVNEMFKLDLPESDEYMTVGGLILNRYRSFPKLNEVVTVGRYEFRIMKNTMTKIELVKLSRKGDNH